MLLRNYTDDYVEDLQEENRVLQERVDELEARIEELEAEIYPKNQVTLYLASEKAPMNCHANMHGWRQGLRLKSGDVIDLETGDVFDYYECTFPEDIEEQSDNIRAVSA